MAYDTATATLSQSELFERSLAAKLRVCEELKFELETTIGDLENLLDGLRFLHRESCTLCDQARTERPEDDAPEDAFCE